MPSRRHDGCRSLLRAALVGLLLAAGAASAQVPVPSITGPISSPGSAFVTPPSALDLASLGWVEEEFFLSGTARAFTASAPLGSDGKWTAAPNGPTAPYTTRILVRRPIEKREFNGTVVVEWLNVSGGLDAAPDWTFVQTLLRREGFAWVGVSAQFQGVAGTGGPLGLSLALKTVNPQRYGPLSHPGDSFSYDIYSQVAAALRSPNGPAPLGPLKPRRIIAIGESQSAFRLTTYVNAVHPTANVYDGFLVHSRGAGSAPLSQAPQAAIPAPSSVHVRDDVDVPTMIFQAETDLVLLGYFADRQPDAGNVRLWEVAGTAHDDTYGLSVGPGDAGRGAADTTYDPPVTSIFGVFECDAPINAGPQHYVLNAALWRLNRWVRTGRVRGGSAPRLAITPGSPPVIERDAFGNAFGGIRTPAVDVPVATHSGLGQTGSAFCGLFGTTVPFDAATLAALYPSHAHYVRAVVRAARQAMRAGYLLKADVIEIKRAAKASSIGG